MLCIVLRAVAYKETDRMLTLYSPERGRFSALARGARKSNGKLHAVSEPLSCGEFSFNGQEGRLYLSQVEQKLELFSLTSDYPAFCAAMLMLEVTEIFATEEGDLKLFALLTNSLAALKRGDPASLAVFFLSRLCELSGVGLSEELPIAAETVAAARASLRCPLSQAERYRLPEEGAGRTVRAVAGYVAETAGQRIRTADAFFSACGL